MPLRATWWQDFVVGLAEQEMWFHGVLWIMVNESQVSGGSIWPWFGWLSMGMMGIGGLRASCFLKQFVVMVYALHLVSALVIRRAGCGSFCDLFMVGATKLAECLVHIPKLRHLNLRWDRHAERQNVSGMLRVQQIICLDETMIYPSCFCLRGPAPAIACLRM